MIRVLIVDDSPTQRVLLRKILESDPDMAVAGDANDGEEAIALCRKLDPDIITMDIQMPRMDGYQAIKAIMKEMPRPIVVLTTTESDIRLGITYKALEGGALTVARKPHVPVEKEEADNLISQLKAMADVKVVGRRRWSRGGETERKGNLSSPRNLFPSSVRLVAIGVSTGGPPSLQVILSQLPAGFSVPIMVVQHISRGFVAGLAAWLNETTSLEVRVARLGEKLKPGTVYLAPDDQHLAVTAGGYVWLKNLPVVDGHCPSATVLFESVAEVCGPAAIGIILTGMGTDGARGLKTLHDTGAYTIAQDEASSVIFGMPKAAVAIGAVDEVLPLDLIGERMKQLVSA